MATGVIHFWASLSFHSTCTRCASCVCTWLGEVEEMKSRLERDGAHGTLSLRYKPRLRPNFPPTPAVPGLAHHLVLHWEPTGRCHPNGEGGFSSRLRTAWECQGWPLSSVSVLGCSALPYRLLLIPRGHQQQFLK